MWIKGESDFPLSTHKWKSSHVNWMYSWLKPNGLTVKLLLPSPGALHLALPFYIPLILQHGYIMKLYFIHKRPIALTVKQKKKKATTVRFSAAAVLAEQWKLQGLLTNVWPRTCGKRGERSWEWYSFPLEKPSLPGETQTNFSKSLVSQTLQRLLQSWLWYRFDATSCCVMKHPCKSITLWTWTQQQRS